MTKTEKWMSGVERRHGKDGEKQSTNGVKKVCHGLPRDIRHNKIRHSRQQQQWNVTAKLGTVAKKRNE